LVIAGTESRPVDLYDNCGAVLFPLSLITQEILEKEEEASQTYTSSFVYLIL